MPKKDHLIWAWAIERNTWLTATNIPGILNVEADEESRKTETRTEWMLDREVFKMIPTAFEFQPSVDLFASRINCQVQDFFSFRPDPDCIGVDALRLIGREWIFTPSHHFLVYQGLYKKYSTTKQKE